MQTGASPQPGIALDQGAAAGGLIGADVLAGSHSGATVSIADKVAFLSEAAAYPGHVGPVTRRETHMSWLFFLDHAVYKLKKPVRLPYLDFSTVRRREAACRAEYALNQRLAPQVYEAVVPLVQRLGGLAVGGPGEVVDWLVLMRRLDESRTLEVRLPAGELSVAERNAVAELLGRFYRQARRVHVPPAVHLARWRAAIEDNAVVMLNPRLGLPAGEVRAVLAVQRRFLRLRRGRLAVRARQGRILDAHGDLRPEHVWMGPPVKVIDRLEFSPRLRAVDPLDELASFDVEAERLGAPTTGAHVRRRVMAGLHDHPPTELCLFYRAYRAMLRARLSIAHLLEPNPRTPEKWPRQSRAYLHLAARDARRLAALLRRPADR